MIKKYSDILLGGLAEGPDTLQCIDEKNLNGNEIEIEGDNNGSNKQD